MLLDLYVNKAPIQHRLNPSPHADVTGPRCNAKTEIKNWAEARQVEGMNQHPSSATSSRFCRDFALLSLLCLHSSPQLI
jgi:hypothetical protein